MPNIIPTLEALLQLGQANNTRQSPQGFSTAKDTEVLDAEDLEELDLEVLIPNEEAVFRELQTSSSPESTRRIRFKDEGYVISAPLASSVPDSISGTLRIL